MKSIFSLLLVCSTQLGMGQGADTVFVGMDQTVTLAFPGLVSLVDIGKAEVYEGGEYLPLFYHQVQGELVLLKALRPDTLVTSFFVRYSYEGNKYFSAVLATRSHFNPQDSFREIGKPRKSKEGIGPHTGEPALPSESELPEEIQGIANSPASEKYQKKLDLLAKKKQAYKSIGISDQNMVTGLHSMGMDDEVLYIHAKLWNYSKLSYSLAQAQILQMGKGSRSNLNASKMKLVELLHLDLPTQIEPKGEGSLFFVLPISVLRNMDKKSWLEVRLRENKGGRHLSFKIPANTLLKAPTI